MNKLRKRREQQAAVLKWRSWRLREDKRIASWRTSIRRESPPTPALLDGLAKVLDEAERVYNELLRALLRPLREDDELDKRPLRAEAVGRRLVAFASEADERLKVSAIRAACARCYVYLGDVERMDTLQKLSLAQLCRRQPEARWQPPAKLHHAATHVVFPEAFSGAFEHQFETLLSLGTLRLAVFKLGADASGVLRQIIQLANL